MMMTADSNYNYCPAIYTRNITNSPTHLEQVFQILLESQRFGFQRIPLSAHLKKCLYDLSEYYQYYLDNRIMPLLNYRATLPGDEDTSIVFVYDIEEITMMSVHHHVELMDLRPHLNSHLVYSLSDDILQQTGFDPFNVLRGHVTTIEDVFNGETDLIKSAIPAYKSLKKLYNEISESKFDRKKSIINDDLLKKCGMIDNIEKNFILWCADDLQKQYFQRWKCVEKCLKLVKKRSKSNKKYQNIALVRETLAQGAVRLLVSGHSSQIPIENIYSWQNQSKESVLEKIQKRFGDKCTLIYITSSTDITYIHEQMNIPIWTVQARESIELLYKAQRDYLLR